MNIQGFCPQCNEKIPQSGFATGFAICSCGWYDKTPGTKADLAMDKRSVLSLFLGYVLIAGLLGHMVNWGSHSFSIPFLKVSELAGTLSKEGYQDLAQACVDLGKWPCAKTAYAGLYRKTGDPAGLASLAYLQQRIGETKEALVSYEAYVKAGGNENEPIYQYARLLEANSEDESAISMYEASIAANNEVLPVKATAAIVRIMMKQGRYADAKQKIVDFHESAGNAKGYLTSELAEAEAMLKKVAIR